MKKKLTALESFLEHHKSLCTIHRYSDREKRKCSCGLEEARAELAVLKKAATEPKQIEFDRIGGA